MMNLKAIKHQQFFWLIIGVSALVKIVAGLYALDQIPRSYAWYDIAKHLLEGKGSLVEYYFPCANDTMHIVQQYYLVRPPVNVLFYILIIKVFNESVLVYVLFQTLFSTLWGVVFYKLLQFPFKKNISLIGLAIVSFYPYFISKVYNATEENLYLLFLLLGCLQLFKFYKYERIKHIYLAALLFTLTYLTRSTILFFFIPLIGLLFLFHKKFKLKHATLSVGLFLTGMLIMGFYGKSIYGKFTPSDHGGSRLWIANSEYVLSEFPKTSIDDIERCLFSEFDSINCMRLQQMNHLDKEDFLKEKAYTFIRENPRKFLRLVIKKNIAALSLRYHPIEKEKSLSRNIIHTFSYLPVLILGLIGFLFYGKKYRYYTLTFAVFYLSLFAIASILWAHTRHTVPYHLSLIFGMTVLLSEKIKN